MKTTTLKITLPQLDGFAEAVDDRRLNPQITVHESRLAELETERDRRRAEHATLEARIAKLPAEVQAGAARMETLRKAIADRDALALMFSAGETAIALAKTRVADEKQKAVALRAGAVEERRRVLAAAAAALEPALTAMREAEAELARLIDPQSCSLGITWPKSWADEIAEVNATMHVAAVGQPIRPLFHHSAR